MSGSTTTIKPCLWFDGQAEEAVEFYRTVFDDVEITSVMRRPESVPGVPGGVLVMHFSMAGREFMALNGGPEYEFTPAISLVLTCRDQDELDAMWDKLIVGGEPVQCGWLTDRFGLSWQVVPAEMSELMARADAAQADRMMGAMMKMIKLDLPALRRAYEG